MSALPDKGVIDLIRKITDLLESASLPDFCDNKNKCASCGLKSTCYDEEEMDKIMKEMLH